MALLQPDTARIGHPPGKPAEDRVAQELASGTPQGLRRALSALIGADQVLHRAIDLVRYASDASPYRLIPQVVVTPRTIEDIVALLNYCRENGHHATFRAAGTSLCGQSQSDDILIEVRRHWYGMTARRADRLPCSRRARSGSARVKAASACASAEFATVPKGRYFDPEVVTVRAGGATVGDIHRRAYAGELSPDQPVDPRVLM
jgi:FAD/FMN-containing dehydrogenase